MQFNEKAEQARVRAMRQDELLRTHQVIKAEHPERTKGLRFSLCRLDDADLHLFGQMVDKEIVARIERRNPAVARRMEAHRAEYRSALASAERELAICAGSPAHRQAANDLVQAFMHGLEAQGELIEDEIAAYAEQEIA